MEVYAYYIYCNKIIFKKIIPKMETVIKNAYNQYIIDEVFCLWQSFIRFGYQFESHRWTESFYYELQ